MIWLQRRLKLLVTPCLLPPVSCQLSGLHSLAQSQKWTRCAEDRFRIRFRMQMFPLCNVRPFIWQDELRMLCSIQALSPPRASYPQLSILLQAWLQEEGLPCQDVSHLHFLALNLPGRPLSMSVEALKHSLYKHCLSLSWSYLCIVKTSSHPHCCIRTIISKGKANSRIKRTGFLSARKLQDL